MWSQLMIVVSGERENLKTRMSGHQQEPAKISFCSLLLWEHKRRKFLFILLQAAQMKARKRACSRNIEEYIETMLAHNIGEQM